MGMNAAGPDDEVKNLLLQGFRAAKENRREEAYQLFCDVVARDPNSEYGWLYRAATTDSRSEAYVCLEKVLSINPRNTKAQRGLERIREQQQEEGDDNNDLQAFAPASTEIEPGRVSSSEYVSGFNNPVPPIPASSTYPYSVEEARPSSYPGYPGAEAAPSSFEPFSPTSFDPPPANNPNYGYEQSNDVQPRSAIYDNSPADNYYQSPTPVASAVPYAEEEAEDNRAATQSRLRGRNNNNKRAAGFGAEGATNLDRNGRDRQGRTGGGLLIILLFLLLIAALLGIYLAVTRNNSGISTAPVTADVSTTATAAALSATSGTGLTGSVTNSAPTIGTGLTSPGSTNPTATTATGANPGPTTQPGGISPTAAPINTAAPLNPTAAVAPTNPPPAPTPTARPAGSGETASATKPQFYTVRAGDALLRISTQFGTSPDALRAANRYNQPITGNNIFPGNRLIIPVSRPDFRGSGHIVVQGDTLDSIAAKYGTTPDAIIKLNGLTGPNDIKPGDPLLIP